MLLGYIRPDKRRPASAQMKVLTNFGVSEIKVYAEDERRAGDGYPVRDKMVRSIRKKTDDVVVVADFHMLASNGAHLKVAVRSIRLAGAVIVEAWTGRRSDCQADLVDMTIEADDVYANRGQDSAVMSDMGKKGAAKSPATKPKAGRMPPSEASQIWMNKEFTAEKAIRLNNADERFSVKWNQPYAYRKLGPRGVLPERRANNHAVKVAARKQKDKLAMGAIYFIRSDGKGPVKIGFSTDYANRLATLQTSNHRKLEIVGILEGTHADEKKLHHRFYAHHIKGKWFRVSGSLKAFMATLPKLIEVK
jgi:Meiotically up-regulated gene 113